MAAAKSETQPPQAAPAAAPAAPAGAAPAAAAPAAASPLKAWLPIIAAVVLSPALTFATVEFVLLPRLTRQLTAAAAEPAPAKEKEKPKSEKGEGKEGKEGGKEEKEGYEFQSVVVNLAGTMGTRYLKTTFLVTGADATIKEVFETNKPRLTDVTLNVLSSLTLADLEEPGAKNVIREKLVTAYNQTLGRRVAEQVYFSDFVVQ